MRGQQRKMALGTGVCALVQTQHSEPLLLFGVFSFLSLL